jgi:hypothetical protein
MYMVEACVGTLQNNTKMSVSAHRFDNAATRHVFFFSRLLPLNKVKKCLSIRAKAKKQTAKFKRRKAQDWSTKKEIKDVYDLKELSAIKRRRLEEKLLDKRRKVGSANKKYGT